MKNDLFQHTGMKILEDEAKKIALSINYEAKKNASSKKNQTLKKFK